MASAELLLMLLADARLPVAGHTQSAGLEPALRLGLAPDEVEQYVATRLSTIARVEAATAVVARHHLRAGLSTSVVEAAWAARTPSPAMRRTSRAQGRALLRLARTLWPDDPAVATVSGVPQASRAVALGAVAAAGDLPARELARLVGYDDVQTVASAALKLLPLDPADVAAWVLRALPAIDVMSADLAHLTLAEDIPASGAPQIEAWAEAHARTTRRLFSA